MSKIKIVGHASGSGVLTIAAPNTNTDRTITIPDVTGTLLDSGSALPAANLTGTVADARISALTASKLTGALPAISAANLTAIPAANITGTLPAISGANLTGISAADNTPAFEVYMSANMTGVAAVYTKMVFDSEEFDTDSAFDSTTNYRFTVPAGEGGKYVFHANLYTSGLGGDAIDYSQIHVYKNGANIAHNYQHVGGHSDGNNVSVILDLVATDYIEFYCQTTGGTGPAYATIYTSNSIQRTRAYGYKLAGV